MKKIIVVLFSMVFLVGCSNLMNTPTKKVEYLLSKYQKNDEEVIKQLDSSLISDSVLTMEQKDRYKKIMERQYKDLMYKVKNEAIDGKTAVVEVEVEVYDYAKAVSEIENKLVNNADLYKDSTGEISTTLYNDDKLKSLEDVN